MKYYEKECLECGKLFIGTAHTKTCGAECKRIRNNRLNVIRYHEYKEEPVKAAKETRKRAKPLVDMAVEARKHGMTYGEYMTHLYWEEERKKRKG